MRQADLDDLMKDIEKIYTLIETEEPHVPSIQSNFAVLQEKISSKKFDQKIKELLSEWISHKKEDPLTEEQYNTLYSLIRTRTTGLTQEYERLRKQAIDMRITLLTAIIAALREGTSPDDTDTVAAIDDLENQVRQGEAQSDPALLDKVLLTVLPTIVNE